VVTVTGGKLTTFGVVVADVFRAVRPLLAGTPLRANGCRLVNPVTTAAGANGLAHRQWQRLYGRYGPGAEQVVAGAGPDDLQPIEGTETLWAELAYATAHERVRHLDDLLLRRVRIGLTTAGGGVALLPRIRKVCTPHLPWDHQRWEEEIRRYLDKWRRLHAPETGDAP
jgi:glycerol-3-phosphate dehydrogenase